MVSDSNRQMLVVAAEDYSGASPAQGPGPEVPQTFLDALAANGVPADVYDVDARTRTAPDALGVLSHYKGVIWYTGDDVVTREADGRAGGNADRLALDEMLEMRAYMDEGGRVAYSGKTAGMQFTGAGVGTQYYDPKDEAVCRIGGAANPALDPRRCLLLRGSTSGRRPDQRRAAVLVRRHGPDRRRRPERDHPVRPQRHRQPVRRVCRGR